MVKWADFLISEVHYNDEHTRIIEVKTRQHLETGISNSIIRKSRLEVVSELKHNLTYVTITYNHSTKKWYQGEDVRIIERGNNQFITTDPNETISDNLGDLPEY